MTDEHQPQCLCAVCQMARAGNDPNFRPKLPPTIGDSDLTERQKGELAYLKHLRPQFLDEAFAEGMTTHKGPGRMCYRSVDSERHHLAIYAYSRCDDGRIRMTAWHGSDSTMPGVGRMNTEPQWLIPCGCGNWKECTDEQFAETQRQVANRSAAEVARQKRRLLTKKRRN